jgi:hypothetical protein
MTAQRLSRWTLLILLGVVQPFAGQTNAAPRPDASSASALPSGKDRIVPASSKNVGQAVVPPAPPSIEPSKAGAKGWVDFWVGVAWPLVALIFLAFVACSKGTRRVLKQLASYIDKVGLPGGISLELTKERAPEQRTYFGDSFKTLTDNAKAQYDQRSRAFQIQDKLKTLIEEILPKTLESVLGARPEATEQRATVHVPDIIFEHFLYQLVDYYPDQTGRGRRFSMRYGIIGRSWRLGESVGESDALDPPPPNHLPEEYAKWQVARRKLIEQWGMFPYEAERGSHSRPSYLCVILKTDTPQAVLFVDSKSRGAFGPAEPEAGRKGVSDVAQALENHDFCKRLAEAIKEVMQELSLVGPHLRVDET